MKTTNALLALLVFLQITQIGISCYQMKVRQPAFASQGNPMMDNPSAHGESMPPLKSMPDLPKTEMVFERTKHDFGVIKDDKKVYTSFSFTNKGKEPLLIIGAEGSCGCTVPTWPHEPIAPGKTGSIEIAFDPNGKSGENSKVVTITANTEPTTTILTIKATIVKSS